MDWRHILLQLMLLALLVEGHSEADDNWMDPDPNMDNWMEPDAWSRREMAESNNNNPFDCSRCEAAANGHCPSDGVSLIYYKKFIRNLFSRKKMTQDVDPKLYRRTLTFTVTAQQLDSIEKLEDPRDLDIILTDIFGKAKSPYKVTLNGEAYADDPGTFGLILDILRDLLLLLRHANVRFSLIVICSILCGWYVHRRYRIGVIPLIVGGFLAFGYFITYFECNAKREMERTVHAISKHQPVQKPGFFSSLFGGGTQEPKRDIYNKIKDASKIDLPFCRPDEVAIMYANDIMLKQIQILIEKCSETLESVGSKFGFPYNIIFGVTLIAMVCWFVKLNFKYILGPAVFGRFHSSPVAQVYEARPALPAASTEDRISGDNLKMLLNVITTNTTKTVTGTATPPAISGVQVILEQIEGGGGDASSLADTSSSSSSDTSPTSSNNNSKGNKSLNSKSDVSIEDMPHEAADAKLRGLTSR